MRNINNNISLLLKIFFISFVIILLYNDFANGERVKIKITDLLDSNNNNNNNNSILERKHRNRDDFNPHSPSQTDIDDGGEDFTPIDGGDNDSDSKHEDSKGSENSNSNSTEPPTSSPTLGTIEQNSG